MPKNPASPSPGAKSTRLKRQTIVQYPHFVTRNVDVRDNPRPCYCRYNEISVILISVNEIA